MIDSSPYTALNLLFHLVEDERASKTRQTGSPLLTVTAAELATQVEALRNQGLRPASLADYLGSSPPGPDAFTLSFDDAHPSVLELAAPALAELGVPATVFVPTAHVNETDRVMGWPELRELAGRPGWTVGSHNASHGRGSWRLYAEDEAAQLRRLTDEARSSRAVLEERLGMPISLFAYPFGDAPKVARNAVAAAGYRAAFTVAESRAWQGDLFGIPRLDGVRRGADAEPDAPPGISVVVPFCDRLPVLREMVRRLKEQSYPADRFEVIIVDDGSRADPAGELAPFIDDERVRLLRLDGADQTFRAGQARQAGAEAARFETLLFLDADVAVDRDFLWHVGYCHGLDSKAVVLGYLSGYNLNDIEHVHRLDAIAAADRLTADVVPVIPDRGREPTLRACLDDIHGLPEPWRLAYTGNLSVSRSLLRQAGGFSDEFRGWGFEDVDLGLRLHEAGALWILSRWALGYHISDDAERAGDQLPNNPFRDPTPDPGRFAAALENLTTLERCHPEHAGVAAFCAQVRSDAEEICSEPTVVGVEVGAPLSFDWPFERRLHQPRPGGLPLEEIRERIAYAAKLGARSLYLLGGDVALRPEIVHLIAEAGAQATREITLETSAQPFGETADLAAALVDVGLTGAVVEVLAGRGHPLRSDAVRRGVAALRDAGVRLGAKLVLGIDDQQAFKAAHQWIGDLALPLDSVVLLAPEAARWARGALGHDVEVELWEGGET